MSVMFILEQEFNNLDKNGDGYLDTNEIEKCLERFGFPKSKAAEVLRLYDQNKDGKISKKEFMDAANRKLSQQDVSCACLRRMFKEMDKDKNGKISKEELKNYLKSQYNFVLPQQVDQWIEDYDKNKDGSLNYEEFLDFVRNIL